MNQPHIVSHHPTYVVSQDVLLLATRWGQPKGLSVPDTAFMVPLRQRLYDRLSELFAHVSFLAEEAIRQPLQALVDQAKNDGLVTVSLECAYTICDAKLEFTRQVNSFNSPIKGRGSRRGAGDPRQQMESLRGQTIALVDDVIFSGETIHSIISDLTHFDVRTQRVVAGVAVADGKKTVERSTVAVVGMPSHIRVDTVFEFADIVDQICERDFFPGIPYSGREAAYPDVHNVPYLLPFVGEHLSDWASIPVKEQRSFSRLCLENTIVFWEEVERLNSRKITCKDVPRVVKGYPQDETRFVDLLHQSCKKI